MPRYRVLLTDYAWSDVSVERTELAKIDAELVVADRQDVDSLADLAENVDAIMTCWAQVPRELIAAATKCRIVSRLGIGLDNIDVEFCSSRGIPVTNVPDYCSAEVAEHTVALILSLARHVAVFHHQTKLGRYDLNALPAPRRLEGQQLGIVGLGNIGRQVATRAQGLGLRVLSVQRVPQPAAEGVEFVAFDELLARADFISLHVPLTSDTRHLIGVEQIARMKPGAYLINTSRGGLIDHSALASAIDAGYLAGAALDVQDPEPPDLSQPPYSHPRVIVTPHTAFVSVESLLELRRRAAVQVATRLSGGTPENIVNVEFRTRKFD